MQRVFFGIPVNKKTQRQINELLSPVKKSLQAVRWVPEENRHLTLAFLGNRPVEIVQNLVQSMDKAYQDEAGFMTGPADLARFPNSSGNIIALVFKADAHLSNLYQLTQGFLVENGFDFSRTQFRPHITLGRFKRRSHVTADIKQQTKIRIQVGKVTFYQSTLTPSGSIYLALNETRLD